MGWGVGQNMGWGVGQNMGTNPSKSPPKYSWWVVRRLVNPFRSRCPILSASSVREGAFDEVRERFGEYFLHQQRSMNRFVLM
jgi:hypothetical protein